MPQPQPLYPGGLPFPSSSREVLAVARPGTPLAPGSGVAAGAGAVLTPTVCGLGAVLLAGRASEGRVKREARPCRPLPACPLLAGFLLLMAGVVTVF